MIRRKIILLGATGSIGTSTLNVLRENKEQFELVGISCNNNVEKLSHIANEFGVKNITVTSENLKLDHIKNYFEPNINIFHGKDSLSDLVRNVECDDVFVAVVGISGVNPTIEAIQKKCRILLSCKEVLVCAGEFVTKLAQQFNVDILPVDSEHNAIFQCLYGRNHDDIQRLILTASGGAVRDIPVNKLHDVTVEHVLQHPNWKMGKRITVDSATFANKGLEVIEARWLFDCQASNIDVLVHRQSIIHSMVEFVDGSVIAQMNQVDMEFPIRNCLNYPLCLKYNKSLDFTKIHSFTFEQPDPERSKCLKLAYDCLQSDNNFSTVVFNAADEMAVEAFLSKKLKFIDIYNVIEEVLNNYSEENCVSIQDVFSIDEKARILSSEVICKLS